MSIYSVDNLDEMFEQMRQDQEEADSRVLRWQAAIKSGDYLCGPWEVYLIYSEIVMFQKKRSHKSEKDLFHPIDKSGIPSLPLLHDAIITRGGKWHDARQGSQG